MAQARLIAGLAMAGAMMLAGPAFAAASRFITYSTEAQCRADGILPGPVCGSAFARARASFEAATTAYPTLEQCAKTYGSCAAWPSGGRASFRPPFQGIDVVDTPTEKSVTPSSPLRRLRFAALPLTEPAAPERELTVRGARGTGASRSKSAMRREAPGEAAAPPPRAGRGFTFENGVLTYPAPDRFQPRNLPKTP